MREDRDNVFACDARKPLQEIVDAGALFQILEQRTDWNAGAFEHPRTANLLWGAFDGRAIVPVQHDTSVDLPTTDGEWRYRNVRDRG